ncbi:hypothetical protein NL676_000034 [Syzygium grande]|nr:hypothetical protein NL676_000034 [Syzygium grande]
MATRPQRTTERAIALGRTHGMGRSLGLEGEAAHDPQACDCFSLVSHGKQPDCIGQAVEALLAEYGLAVVAGRLAKRPGGGR